MTHPNDEGRPAANGTAWNVSGTDKHMVRLTGFDRGVILDAFRQAQRDWWLKRADDFERAKPVPGEYEGNATREELSRRWNWCHGVANACRAKAEMVAFETEVEALLDMFTQDAA